MNSLTNSITDSKESYINSMTEINRSIVDSLQESNIVRMSDSDDNTGLQLFCYDSCDKWDTEVVKQCRGIVFSGDSIVMKAFPYTEELKEEDFETFQDQNDLSKCRFYPSYEGVLIRMFFYDGKWFMSTHRKLDAFKSKWSTKVSFGEMFVRCLEKEYLQNSEFKDKLDQLSSTDLYIFERFKSILEKTKQYMFLMLNNAENRIVCVNDPSESQMYHVGTFDSFTLNTVDSDCGISKPQEFLYENLDLTLQNVFIHSQTLDYKKYQGIIIFTPNNKQYKVFNKDYQYFFNIRGNEPSIKFRYLQIRCNSEYSDTIRRMYPEMCSSFDKYDTYIQTIARDIFNAYVERFMKKKFTTVSQDEYVIVKACHSWHLQDRKRNIVSFKRVMEEINNSSPSLINKMIRNRMQKEK